MRWLDAARAWADRHDERRVARDPGGAHERPGPVAASWAVAKMAAVVLTGPVALPVVGTWAVRNTRQVNDFIGRYPLLLDAVLRGDPIDYPASRVARAPAGDRYFIASDLHRTVPGTIDLPGRQDTRALYETILEHYGAAGWALVENGDVEDFWLVGGSGYGAVYDAARMVSAALPGARRDAARLTLQRDHLQRIVANNAGIYERIDDLFHRRGRYFRLAGNHDDCYLDERMVDELRAIHDGLEMLDFLVLDGAGAPVGLVTHGHHTDSWNAPQFAGLGKLGTWLGSTVNDLPLLAANPGVPTVHQADQLLSGAQPNVLTTVSRLFGANRDLYSVDEVLLHDAIQSHWTDGDAPVLVLGHTHLPLARPHHPGRPVVWSRYVNCGSGVTPGIVTGVEWDGEQSDGAAPALRLVAWHWADERTPAEAVIATRGGRAVARRVLEPSAPPPLLRPVPA